MGTRADFYVGRGVEAEWLGSIAWDGYPGGVFGSDPDSDLPQDISEEEHWRAAVSEWLSRRSDATTPEMGWPWPWEDSRTTDYAYAFDEGEVWFSCFAREWRRVADGEPEEYDDAPKTAVFPDMTNRQEVTYGSRSGIMMISPQGVIPPKAIDADEAQRRAER